MDCPAGMKRIQGEAEDGQCTYTKDARKGFATVSFLVLASVMQICSTYL